MATRKHQAFVNNAAIHEQPASAVPGINGAHGPKAQLRGCGQATSFVEEFLKCARDFNDYRCWLRWLTAPVAPGGGRRIYHNHALDCHGAIGDWVDEHIGQGEIVEDAIYGMRIWYPANGGGNIFTLFT